MRHEPPIDRERLIRDLRDAYGVSVERLTFVPVGYAAVCYVVEGEERRSFLKLWPDTNAARAIAERLSVVLPLLRALQEQDLGARVPAPFQTRQGALWAESAGLPLAVFPFLTGRPAPPWRDVPPALRDEFARVVAAIHHATPTLADVLPPADNFAIPFEADLRRGLAALERDHPNGRAGLQAPRDLVLPRRAEVVARLDQLRRLGAAARRLPGPSVLCHTDLGGDNMLVDERGGLAVLDWDNATLAPAEFDLWPMLDDDFGRFLEVYQAHGGARLLHRGRFAFALSRRALGDLTARLVRLLEEPVTPDEEREALAGIGAWGFARWARLDELLDRNTIP